MNLFNLSLFDDDEDDHGGLQEDAFISSLIMTYNIMMYGRKKAREEKEGNNGFKEHRLG